MDPALEHLQRPALQVIWREYARRLNRGDQPEALSLNNLTEDEQQALADLLGMDRLPGKAMRLSIKKLCKACRVDNTDPFYELAKQVAGPIVNRKLERQQQQQIKTELWQWLTENLTTLPYAYSAQIDQWIEEQRSKGISYQRRDEYKNRCKQMLAVLKRLPANGVSLPILAADVLGDPHALDANTALGHLCIDAYCALNELPRDNYSYRLRRQWEWAGVALDGVSSTVLILGLRNNTNNNHREWLQYATDQHEPVVLTYRQICKWPAAALSAGQHAVVLENPSLIEAAADANVSNVPVICSAGQPTLAVQTLVRQLRANGCTVLQHADFDASGLHITKWFQQHTGTTPWKMNRQHYLDAIQNLNSPSLPLENKTLPVTPWDNALSESMQRHGIYISEEQVRADLLNGIRELW